MVPKRYEGRVSDLPEMRHKSVLLVGEAALGLAFGFWLQAARATEANRKRRKDFFMQTNYGKN
jgi:hypothetical protein